jgi:hypothetical protein
MEGNGPPWRKSRDRNGTGKGKERVWKPDGRERIRGEERGQLVRKRRKRRRRELERGGILKLRQRKGRGQ